MTSTPVKDVNSLMNFIGGKNFTKAGATAKAGGFSDVMNLAQNTGQAKDNVQQNLSKPAAASQSAEKPSDALKDQSRKEGVKTQDAVAKAANAKDTATKEDAQAVEEAGKEMVKGIAEELGVSEEEVEKAMEELGLSLFALFEPANLTQLALVLSGEQDAAAILTDEGLFTSLQNLMGMAEDVKGALMQEMDLAPEDFKALLENMQQDAAGSLVNDALSEPEEAVEEAPQITLEVKTGGETVKLAADENGNAIKTVEVTPNETREDAAEANAGNQGQKSDEGKGETESGLHTGNPLIDASNQNTPQTAEVPFEQTVPMFSEQTQDIMDQIMNYMKIQLRPGMDQLEMQLHPESLGTVHVQLVSKGGEVTAQFHVQNEAVKAAIESQISTLQENLKEQGVKVEAVQVTVEGHGFESNLWQGQGREEDAASNNSRKTPRRINLNDLTGFMEEDATEEELLAARVMEMNGTTVDYTA